MDHLKKNMYIFIVEKTETGFSAYEKNSQVYTTGKELTELKANCTEALTLFYGGSALNPEECIIRFVIDFPQFFRHYRVINARFLARRIGMNPTLLSQYIHGKKHPSEVQQQKILRGLREIGKELSEIGFTP